MLELYNTTDRVRRVPKYRYNGTYVLNPKSCVDVEEYTAKFFEPWRKVGVVVRVKAIQSEIEDIKTNKVEETKTEDIKEKDECHENNVELKEKENEDSSINDKSEEAKNKELDLSEETLSEMGLKDLKDIATSLGIELEDARKKSSVIKDILSNTNKN